MLQTLGGEYLLIIIFVAEALDALEISTDALASRTKREAFSEDERRIAGVSYQDIKVYSVTIQGVWKFLLQTSRICRGD